MTIMLNDPRSAGALRGVAEPRNAKPVEAEAFRSALSHYPSGLTIVAGVVDDVPVGFTCQAFYSVSVEPPLVSVSVMKSSSTYPLLRRAGRFSINVLSAEQHHLARQFAARSGDRWRGVAWEPDPAGNPIIAGALVSLGCELWAEHEAGDHDLVIGHVQHIAQTDEPEKRPLVYFRSTFRSFD